MKSDDDIDELSERIKNVSLNSEEIFKAYVKFRKDYSKKSKDSIEHFLGYKNQKNYLKKEPEKLLSVIVPVYNTSKYLENCLNSIVSARIDDMEILMKILNNFFFLVGVLGTF